MLSTFHPIFQKYTQDFEVIFLQRNFPPSDTNYFNDLTNIHKVQPQNCDQINIKTMHCPKKYYCSIYINV